MTPGSKNGNSLKKQFSNSESFRLCTEGLQALERFERRASRSDLELAENRLGECVRLYPGDILPKFYLGSVKTLVGYRGLGEAVTLLSEVAERGRGDLKASAQYNLAVARIEQYESESAKLAKDLLAPLAEQQPNESWVKWSARVNLLYLRAEEVWKQRKSKSPDPAVFASISSLVSEFERFDDEVQGSAFRYDADILADYWNALGTLFEARAWLTESGGGEFADQARKAYEKALGLKSDWVAATSNLARLYQERFNDPETARRLWQEVLKVRPDDEYAHYNLGLIDLQAGNREKAREHFQKAPEIDKAAAELKRLDEEPFPQR